MKRVDVGDCDVRDWVGARRVAPIGCAIAAVAALAGCNSLLGNRDFSGPGDDVQGDAGHDAATDVCVGIGCMVADCASRGKPPTSLSGTVYAPDGMLPLYNAVVYVPTGPLAAIGDGPTSLGCVSGAPVALTRTDVTGHFKLTGVPSVANLPVVIQLGKWRRQITVPAVDECADHALPASDTHLPRSASEGHLPRIALTTGQADTLECIARSVGVSDGEYSAPGGSGRIHLYAGDGNGVTNMIGTTVIDPVDALYDRMMQYDMLLFNCDGRQITRPSTAQDAMKQYVDAGGWVWLEHFHSNWVMAPSPFPLFASFDINGAAPPSPVIAKLDTATPKGAVFAEWMDLVGATVSGQLQITEGRNTCVTYNPALSQRLVYLDPAVSAGFTGEQLVSWSTAAGGRVLYSDIHFLQPTTSLGTFPNECTTTALSAQGKSIAFQLFDQPTCIP